MVAIRRSARSQLSAAGVTLPVLYAFGGRMKGLFGRLAIMTLVSGMAIAAHAADVSGTWKGSLDIEGNSVPVTMNLKASDAAVTGTLEGLPSGSVEIHDGKINGEAL